MAGIYHSGLATGLASFETDVPSWEQWEAAHLAELRFVAEARDGVVGWLAASPVSRRECYRGVVEHSVYVDEASRGKGAGRALLERLVAEAPAHGSGRSRRQSSWGTRRASPSMRRWDSERSAAGSASRSATASGTTRCCSSSGCRSADIRVGHRRAARGASRRAPYAISRASVGRRRRRCGRRSRRSSTPRSRPAARATRSGCSRGRTRDPALPG